MVFMNTQECAVSVGIMSTAAGQTDRPRSDDSIPNAASYIGERYSTKCPPHHIDLPFSFLSGLRKSALG